MLILRLTLNSITRAAQPVLCSVQALHTGSSIWPYVCMGLWEFNADWLQRCSYSLLEAALSDIDTGTRASAIVIPGSLVVRIRRSHRRGRGSIPRQGKLLSTSCFVHLFYDKLTQFLTNNNPRSYRINTPRKYLLV